MLIFNKLLLRFYKYSWGVSKPCVEGVVEAVFKCSNTGYFRLSGIINYSKPKTQTATWPAAHPTGSHARYS